MSHTVRPTPSPTPRPTISKIARTNDTTPIMRPTQLRCEARSFLFAFAFLNANTPSKMLAIAHGKQQMDTAPNTVELRNAFIYVL